MVKKILLAALAAQAIAVGGAEKPEISWSIMHPTGIDIGYMKRVAAKAAEYGGVDSFEVCGDCHSPYGGINGLSMLDPYPKAHAQVDPKAVEKARADLNAIVDIAHSVGKPLYYWHREIFIPKALLEDLPRLLDEDGEFDLLGKTYQDYLRFKIGEAFKHVPGLDGIALTLTEADFSVIHNSNPKRYPPPKVVESLVRIFAEEHAKRGKRFILRSFGSIRKDYEDIIAGAVAAAKDHAFEIETKVTEADFVPWLPKNPFLKKNPPLTLGAECDALGEYLGAGYLPAAQVERIREYVESAREEDVDRYTIRIDRVGNTIFDSAHEVNLYAYMRFIRDPAATADEVYAEYAKKHYGAAADEMAALEKTELEMVRNIHFVASNLVFHSFPLKSDMKVLKACGIFGLYREHADLSMSRGSWSILHWQKAPTHERILKEKALGLKAAEDGLAKIRSLKAKLPADEFSRLERAWSAAVFAGRTIKAFTGCVVAYFEDMAARQDTPYRLRAAVADAIEKIESQMTDVNDFYPGGREYFNVCGRNLDRVYAIGLRYACNALLEEYDAERKVRRELEARADVCDFVVAGGIYDDGRVLRPMHAAHAELRLGRVMRRVGNPVFPNGTITVKFRDVPGAKVEVALDVSGAQVYSCQETVSGGVRTVTIGKKGADYPCVRSVALVKPAAEKKPLDISFARGRWDRGDFFLAKSWRWNYLGDFDQLDDAIVNRCPALPGKEIYEKHHSAVYAAIMHRREFPLGVTVSSKMMFDYRMAPIIVIAPMMGENAKGVPEFRDHWEVCLYDKGINLWYHYFENGRQKWYKASAIQLPPAAYYKANQVYDLKVKVWRNKAGAKEFVITCGDYQFQHTDERIPEKFQVGLIACEGRNFFYDLKVE
jgi:hypothetical protein